ncbi:MAG TPA: YetF domain-containing protein [Chthonomonadaceae bacterium]|nr:YetF domain-containing protein [Chthonomonadaceae bacterium]
MLNHWLNEVLSHPTPLGAAIIVGRTSLIYLFLVAGLRLLGKRELGQMNIYDLVLLIVLANAVQNAMVGDDTTLGGGIIAALTLLILNRFFTLALTRSPKLERLMCGEPVLLVNDGQLLTDRMRREGITREQVMAALREHGLSQLDQVHMAVLEVDGTISVVPREAEVHKTRHHYRALRLP